jgi:hypothetical protein
MDSADSQLIQALMTLRNALSEMALILSDYQFDADIAKRKAAMEQVREVLDRVACQRLLPGCERKE